MQSTPTKTPRDKTLLWASLTGFIFTLLINIIIDGYINAMFGSDTHAIGKIIGRSLGNFIFIFFILYVSGSLFNVIIKSKKGYWFGLLLALTVHVFVRMNS